MSKEFEAIVLNKLENLEIGQKNINQRLGILETEVKDTGEVVKYLNNNFTRFDFEINKKIDTLFDANKVNKEKNDTFKEELDYLAEKSFNHDIRISNLEDKVLIA